MSEQNEKQPAAEERHEDASTELFDSLAQECGEVIGENEQTIVVEDKDKLQSAVNRAVNRYAYDDRDIPMPGEPMDDKLFRDLTKSDKDQGIDRLIAENAIAKAEKETAEIKKKRAKEEQKEDIIKQIMYAQEQEWYKKYKYMMSGQQKRQLRRIIERDYRKGKYDAYIIDESGIPLN